MQLGVHSVHGFPEQDGDGDLGPESVLSWGRRGRAERCGRRDLAGGCTAVRPCPHHRMQSREGPWGPSAEETGGRDVSGPGVDGLRARQRPTASPALLGASLFIPSLAQPLATLMASPSPAHGHLAFCSVLGCRPGRPVPC